MISGFVALLGCDKTPTGAAPTPSVLWTQHFQSLGSEIATDGYRVFVMGTHRSVTAFRITTGDVLWSASTAAGDTTRTQALTTTGRLGCVLSYVSLVCDDRDLVGIGVVDGVFRWRSPVTVSCTTACEPIMPSDSSVYVFTTTGTLLNAAEYTGNVRWAASTPASGVSIDTGLVALGSNGGSSGAILALSVGTGAKRWSTALPLSARQVTGTALWQNLVLASASDGNVYGLDRTSGSIVWTAAGADTASLSAETIPCVSGTTAQPMLVLGNSLFIATSTGTMAMFDLSSHTLLHRVPNALGPHLGVPLVTDSAAIYVIGLNGDVGAFSTSDLHLRQAYSVSGDKICAIAQYQDRIFAVGVSDVYAISKALNP